MNINSMHFSVVSCHISSDEDVFGKVSIIGTSINKSFFSD